MPENPLKPSGWRERLALRVLESLSRPAGTADSIAEILRVIVEETGIQSAGIRLRDGDDFPFHVFHGLTEEFVRAENNLAPVAPGGTCATDAQGDPALACLCGVVLEGRTDGGPGFFTPGGSFYAGHLQGQIGEIDLDQVPAYRPRCVLTGIETQALIPLREQAEIIGLLHLSDRRTEVLSRDDVEFMERLSASIGMALARQRAESTENRWRAVIQNEPECVKLLDREGRLLAAGCCRRPPSSRSRS